MPTVTCMFRGPQPEAKCLVCAQARHACTHNAFMWRCVFELWRKGGLTGASRPRREACLPAPPGYRPVCSPQTSRLPLPRPRFVHQPNAKTHRKWPATSNIKKKKKKVWERRVRQKVTFVNRAGSHGSGGVFWCLAQGRLLTDGVWGEVGWGNRIPFCTERNATGDSAELRLLSSRWKFGPCVDDRQA